ncbi:MAG: hypothetical protein C0616_01935 [Desulfuromonas sp.]|nr:MAG: hypothetical protein C0616_01935 [Desulfuromonas sp.]
MTLTSTAGKSSNQNGFTLAEVAIVTLLLALFAGFVMPRMLHFGDSDLSRSSRYLAGTAKYLYSEAVLTGLEHRLVFSLDGNRYMAKKVAVDGNVVDVEGRATERSLTGEARFKDVQIDGRGSFSRGEINVVFLPSGWVDQTTIHLVDGDGANLTLLLDSLTGSLETFQGYQEF